MNEFGPIKGGLLLLLAVSAVCACTEERETETDSASMDSPSQGATGTLTKSLEAGFYIDSMLQQSMGIWDAYDMSEEKTLLAGAPFRADETCCTKPGEISECWAQDAEDDGVRCDEDSDCPSGTCDMTYQVCTCATSAQCGKGVCTSHNLCGPSWCNGYKICSCWLGCVDASPDIEPQSLCDNRNLNCCNGSYSIHPKLRDDQQNGTGYCSDNDNCDLTDGWCIDDIHCPPDGNLCTADRCNTDTNTCYYDNDPLACDDGNTCTTDSCNPATGCSNVNNSISCNDNNACTDNDTCSEGGCSGTPITCDDGNPCTDNSCDIATGCVFTDNTAACNDGDACTVDDICSAGVCAGTTRVCSDGNDCTDDSCDSASGCEYAPNTDACDDGDACTSGDACAGGTCVSGAAVVCDDGNICTDDTCDPATGCEYADNTAACNDGNACTAPDVCAGGTCVPGADIVCADGNDCTNDSCDPDTGCVFADNTIPCDDGNDCSFDDVCAGGTCAGTEMGCDDANSCTIDVCNPAVGCTYVNDEESACDDGNKCTVDDRCSVGGCGGVLIHWRLEKQQWDGSPDEVVDSADMYHGTTNNDPSKPPLLAYTIPDGRIGRGARLDAGNGINVGHAGTGYKIGSNTRTMAMWVKFDDVDAKEQQTMGAYAGSGKRFYLGIDDDNEIHAGYGSDFVGDVPSRPSVPSGISSGEWARMVLTYDGTSVHIYVNNVFKISFETSFHQQGQGPEFFLGTKAGNVEVDEIVVDERYWPQAQVARDYDNGNGPNPYDYTLNCDDNNSCTDDSCDKDVGCVNTPNNTGSCDDGNPCTVNDVCSGGTCGGDAVDCDDGNICTTDSCDAIDGCIHKNNTASCDDGNTCTTNDVCAGGTCGGAAMDCDDGDVCTTDSCVDGVGCQHEDNTESCDDGNVCTENDVCAAGACAGTPADCGDGDACTQDTCNPSKGCLHEELIPCPNCTVDGDCGAQLSCTPQPEGCSTAVCNAGVCECDPEPNGTSCSDYNEGDYPPSCYHGLCDGSGNCLPTEHPAYNNLCSDAFVDGDDQTISTTKPSYIGLFENTDADGTTLAVTGTTNCAANNYEAGGDYCDECEDTNDDDICDTITGNIGAKGPDLVYVFEYETNTDSQFELYSYIIKVEATFDVGVYIKTDITEGGDCPEGWNQGADGSFSTAASAMCEYPYDLGGTPPPPTVVEDDCADDGNTGKGQDCCDPCTEKNCYKWCKRGYMMNGDACDMCDGYASAPDYDPWTYKGDCDRLWTYPDDVFDCSPSTPAEDGYDDYIYMASSVISPEGATDGSKRKVFVFVDGVAAEEGDFYLSVERRRWYASPCDRVEDDARVYDITNVGSGGQTYVGSLDDVVNSMHGADEDTDDDTCGGYDCDIGFSGKSDCHGPGSANEFWPNTEIFKIHRPAGSGKQTYCVMTDESIDDAADAVIVAWYRGMSYYTICDAGYGYVNCAHDTLASGNARFQFTAEEGRLYLIALSEYSAQARPCDSATDNCNYKFTVTEGECGLVCTTPNETVAGSDIVINDPAYGVESRSGTITAGSNDDYFIDSDDEEDDVYELWNNTGATVTVTFEACGDYDAMIGLYNCEQTKLTSYNLFGDGTCDGFSYALPPSTDPYYVTVDTFGTPALGAYTLTVSWGSPPVTCVDPLTTFYSGGTIYGTRTINGLDDEIISGDTSDPGDPSDKPSGNNYDPTSGSDKTYDGPDDLWQLDVTADSTVTFSACDEDTNGEDYKGRIVIFDCEGTPVVIKSDGCGTNFMPVETLNLHAYKSPYYILIDGDGNQKADNEGMYSIKMSVP